MVLEGWRCREYVKSEIAREKCMDEGIVELQKHKIARDIVD